MSTSLSFYGGVREVTGSNFLLQTDNAKILVDCGLHQGCHFCEGRNRQPFPYDPASVDAVVVTHAHADHTGLLPKLVREGFSGTIFSTPPTRDLASVMLEDSAELIGDEAKMRGEEPLYEQRDVARAMERFETIPYRTAQKIAPGVSIALLDAGHILGSATVVVTTQGQRIVFSGDLGNSPTPLLRDRDTVDRADYVLIESVYGDRRHEDRDQRRKILESLILKTVEEQGVLLLAVFAMERTQEMLSEINALIAEKRIRPLPVFVDSPLAVKVTEIYRQYAEYYNDETKEAMRKGDLPLVFPGLEFSVTVEESKNINAVPPPKVILAGAGMMQGGRILHHLRRYLPDPRSTLLIMGYQAAGSLGRSLLKRPSNIRIFGETVAVRARIKAIGGYSSHADQDALVEWLSQIKTVPKKVFVVQGELSASYALREEIRHRLGWDAMVPMPGERINVIQ